MRESRAIMAELAASGLRPDQIALMLELTATLAAEVRLSVDVQAERRRAKDRERKRANSPRNSAEIAETASPEVSPNDIYSNPHPNPSTPADAFAEQVVGEWNDGPAKNGATHAKPLDAGRRKALASRLKEHSREEVSEAIRNIAASPFHCGKNDRGWRANIGWMLKSPENFQKALELEPQAAPQRTSEPADFLAHMIARRRANG